MLSHRQIQTRRWCPCPSLRRDGGGARAGLGVNPLQSSARLPARREAVGVHFAFAMWAGVAMFLPGPWPTSMGFSGRFRPSAGVVAPWPFTSAALRVLRRDRRGARGLAGFHLRARSTALGPGTSRTSPAPCPVNPARRPSSRPRRKPLRCPNPQAAMSARCCSSIFLYAAGVRSGGSSP